MNFILYIIAFLEGFTTLSVEIMSIRNSISIIGSNAIATSIILGIILLALSYGYYRGGVYASIHAWEDIKRKIYRNLLIASLFYTFVSFPLENKLLSLFLGYDIGYFIPVFLAISILFIVPVFLASQTIPLLSELIDDDKKAVVLGKLLFFSTIGSFMGSVVTSLIFFSTIWVEKSIVVNGLILAVLALVILLQYRKRESSQKWLFLNIFYIFLLLGFLFSDISRWTMLPGKVYGYSSEYNDIAVFDYGKTRLFSMNGSYSSGLDVEKKKSYFSYIEEVTQIIDREKPKKILIIGAAGFTLPQSIANREYIDRVDVCDIDGSLQDIAEKYFLKEPLHPKIQFFPESARYFIQKKIRAGEKYDFIFLDAYNGKISIPSELLTKDFFDSVRQISSSTGTIAMNLILDSLRNSLFSQKLTNTLMTSFSWGYMRAVHNWADLYDNFIFLDHPFEGYPALEKMDDHGIYTDDQNTLEFDKYQLFYQKKYN
jgi:spermidine synthase